jgi:uncharacterized protein YecE (DUF72 family)
VELRTGTSGFSYAGWKGSFYPADLPNREMLSFYAGRLPAVEINNTFYRLPKASVLEGWARQVPESFRFVLKASRRITHFKRLRDAGDETGYLLRTAEALGPRLGAILFQLPPNLACDAPRLEAFLDLLPAGTRAAVEFRHPSWRDERVHALLGARDFALVGVDDDDAGLQEIVPTARWGYLRLRRAAYDRAELAAWARRIAGQGWDEAFVFFKHEDDGAGPRLAAEFSDVFARAAERRPPVAAARARERREAG